MKSKCEFCGGELCKEIEFRKGKPPIIVCKEMYEGIKKFIKEYDEDNDFEITGEGIKLRVKK